MFYIWEKQNQTNSVNQESFSIPFSSIFNNDDGYFVNIYFWWFFHWSSIDQSIITDQSINQSIKRSEMRITILFHHWYSWNSRQQQKTRNFSKENSHTQHPFIITKHWIEFKFLTTKNKHRDRQKWWKLFWIQFTNTTFNYFNLYWLLLLFFDAK